MFQFQVTENILNACVCRLLERHQRKGKSFRVPICSWKKSFGKCSGDFLCLLLLSSICLGSQLINIKCLATIILIWYVTFQITELYFSRKYVVVGSKPDLLLSLAPSHLASGNCAVISDSELTRWHLVCFVLRLFLSKIERTATVVDTAAGTG